MVMTNKPMTINKLRRMALSNTLLLLLFFPLLVSAATNQEGLDWLAENAKKDGVVSDYSGMQYKILQRGHGVVSPASGQAEVACHFEGRIINGEVFDATPEGEPYIFRPIDALDGWFSILLKMVVGDVYELYLPSDLAFGDEGSKNKKVKAGDVAIFKLELVEITGKTKSALECNPEKPKRRCTDEEKKFIDEVKQQDKKKLQKELKKLSKKLKKPMKPELEEWVHRRIHILNQLVVSKEGDGKQEL